jgi:hypothetical protein
VDDEVAADHLEAVVAAVEADVAGAVQVDRPAGGAELLARRGVDGRAHRRQGEGADRPGDGLGALRRGGGAVGGRAGLGGRGLAEAGLACEQDHGDGEHHHRGQGSGSTSHGDPWLEGWAADSVVRT